MAPLAEGVTMDHIARQSKDVRLLADFYIEVVPSSSFKLQIHFGFEEVESPQVGLLKVIWLIKPSAFTMHLVEFNNPSNQSNDNTAAVAEIPMGHHICFSVSNFETFVQKLKEKGIETAHMPVEYNLTGSKKIDQVFFFDPDGNSLEVYSTAAKWVAPTRNAD